VLITGPALPDIFLSLIAFYFLVKSVWQKRWFYYQNKLVIGFLLFSVYGIIRSLFSDMPLESLTNEGSVFYFRYIFFAMGVWYLLDNNPYLTRCLLTISISCLILVSLDGLYQYLLDVNIFGNEKHSPVRLTGLFGKEPILGRYIAYLSIFTFALIYQSFQKTKMMMSLSVAFLVMSEVIVFLTGERAPLFYVSFFTVLIIIFIPHYRIYRIVGILASVIIILSIFQINPNAKSRMIDHTIKQINEKQLPVLPYSSAHEEHYISALKMFNSNPFFGVGTNTFRFNCSKQEYAYKFSCSSHPHHFYLQALAELGIIGFFFLTVFFIYLTFIGSKQLFFMIKSNKSKKIPFEFLLYPMALFIFWWPLVPHMSLYNNWNNILMMLPLGFFMRYFYGNTKNGNFSKI
jgi:O-antigen ligase